MNKIVEVKNISKQFKVTKRENGNILNALKSIYSKEYDIIDAVKNVDFAIEQGEIRGLIGPNGAGKSTTIKMMCGILYPTEGEVIALGYNTWKSRKEFVKNIGAVFGQKTQLWWDLPAIDTFCLNKNMYDISSKEFNDNLSYYVDLFKAESIISHPVRQLSLGERMKCELINSLIHNPQIVFLDEPTIGLDIVSKEIIKETIKRVNTEKNTTFILTTHDLLDVEDLCENVTIINNGQKVYDDKVASLRNYYCMQKNIEVCIRKKEDINYLKDFNIIKKEECLISILIQSDEELKKFLNLTSTVNIFSDINIKNIGIDEIIKEIYLKKDN